MKLTTDRLENACKKWPTSWILKTACILHSPLPRSYISEAFELTDIQTALIRASRYAGKGFDHILHVGAEKFYLVKKDPDGRYESSRTNTSCAAGTGSFLDQQVKRLDIVSIEEFCRLAEANRDNVPDIASRCSVFAKTDLIHAQQEGLLTGGHL